jgi:hypothetical protein
MPTPSDSGKPSYMNLDKLFSNAIAPQVLAMPVFGAFDRMRVRRISRTQPHVGANGLQHDREPGALIPLSLQRRR